MVHDVLCQLYAPTPIYVHTHLPPAIPSHPYISHPLLTHSTSSLDTVHCTTQIAVIAQTCIEDGAGCEQDDLHPLTLPPSHSPSHPPTPLLTLTLPPLTLPLPSLPSHSHLSPSHSPPHTPTLPLPSHGLTLSSLSPSPHSLFSILAAILHLGNIQFFKVSTEMASTAQCELVTGCPSLSNSPLHVGGSTCVYW